MNVLPSDLSSIYSTPQFKIYPTDMNCLYSHLYLDLKNIFILKKSSTFANLVLRNQAIYLL